MSVVSTFGQLKNNPTNLSAVNLSNFPVNGSKFFNNFFDTPITINSAKDNAIVSYFEQQTHDHASAVVLASAVIYTSQSIGLDPMVILDEFKKISMHELNQYLANFLNLSRVPTSLIGTQVARTRNKYIARTIIA